MKKCAWKFQDGSHSVLSYIDVQDQVIPDNVVLHGLKQRNGKFIVRIFGVNDNPKENRLFGRDLDELEDTLGVRFWAIRSTLPGTLIWVKVSTVVSET